MIKSTRPRLRPNPYAKGARRSTAPPLIRERVREQVYRDFNGQGLCLRRIREHHERAYFSRPISLPRPVCVARRDVQTVPYILHHPFYGTEERDGKICRVVPVERNTQYEHFNLVLTGLNMLAVYKKNAYTGGLSGRDPLDPANLTVPCLPDQQSGCDKITQMSDRKYWETLPPMTSGKLQARGLYSHPKPVSLEKRSKVLVNNEFVTTGYTRNNIVAVAYNQKDAVLSWSSCLYHHERCRQVMGLNFVPSEDVLPLVIYSVAGASLEVCYANEICAPDQEQQLLHNEHYTLTALLLSGANIDSYIKAHCGLAAPDSARAIYGQNWTPAQKQLCAAPPYRQALKELVSNPALYNVDQLQYYCSMGARPEMLYMEDGYLTSAVDMLLTTELVRCSCHCDTGHTPDCLQTMAQARRLLEEMLHRGCRPTYQVVLGHVGGCYPHMADWLCAIDAIETDIDLLDLASQLRGLESDLVCYPLLCERYVAQGIQKHESVHNALIYFLSEGGTRARRESRGVLHCLYQHGGNPWLFEDELTQALRKKQVTQPYLFRHIHGSQSVEEIVADILSGFECWLNSTDRVQWADQLARAQATIDNLRQSLPQHSLGSPKPQLIAQAFSFLAEAYDKPPTFTGRPADNESTVLAILNHYYRRPGYQTVVAGLAEPPKPIEKPSHSCSHGLRVRNNSHCFMALLEQFGFCSLSDQEKQLLPLAALYINSAREHVVPQDAAKVAGEYFRRDMAAYFDRELVDQLADVLTSIDSDKSARGRQPKGRQRLFAHLLRMSERADAVRHDRLEADFPQTAHLKALDVPPSLARNKQFVRACTAMLQGAADLACTTGGQPLADNRQQVSYLQRHRLDIDNDRLKQAFEDTPCPVLRMNAMRDDSVRRTMAIRAGLQFCASDESPACQPNFDDGVCFGIHNTWHDLQQIRIPEYMTTLEKMQIGHDWNLLSEQTQTALANEVARLKMEGIKMSLGTLTQRTLQSPAAVAKLQSRGLAVVSEQRPRGVSQSGENQYQTMFYTVPAGSRDQTGPVHNTAPYNRI